MLVMREWSRWPPLLSRGDRRHSGGRDPRAAAARGRRAARLQRGAPMWSVVVDRQNDDLDHRDYSARWQPTGGVSLRADAHPDVPGWCCLNDADDLDPGGGSACVSVYRHYASPHPRGSSKAHAEAGVRRRGWLCVLSSLCTSWSVRGPRPSPVRVQSQGPVSRHAAQNAAQETEKPSAPAQASRGDDRPAIPEEPMATRRVGPIPPRARRPKTHGGPAQPVSDARGTALMTGCAAPGSMQQ